jgi:purine-binding chemotaxis protein CheW
MQTDSVRNEDRAATAHYLISRTHTFLCALPITQVCETLRPQSCQPLAGMPPFLLGASIIRGSVVPVIDLARLLGSTISPTIGRLVTVQIGDRFLAFAVEAVVGVRLLSLTTIDETPPLLGQVADEALAAIATLDRQLLYVLKSACIVPESVWQAMAMQPLLQ